jgi:hypothetical protein
MVNADKEHATAGVPWLVRSRNAEETIIVITAPDAPVGVGAAVDRLEAALQGFSGRKPAWFAVLERLGYWWYPICMAAAAAVFVLFAENELGVGWNLAYGLGSGIGIAVITGAIAWTAAHLQARLTNGATVDELIREVAPLARPGGSVVDRVDAILAWDPAREREVHDLAWRAAGIGTPNRSAAERELDALWRRADPAGAAERDAMLLEIEATVAELRRKRLEQGKR